MSGFLFCSSYQIQKYTRNRGLCIYLLLVPVLLYYFLFRLCPYLIERLSSTQVFFFSALLVSVLALIFFLLYPLANSGVVGGGSDNDDAYNVAVRALLQGKYPYHEVTYLGGSIAYFPGALFLATPFVLLGNAAYQNLFWLIALYFYLNHLLKDTKVFLFLMLSLVLFCPAFTHTLIVGSDLIASGIYIFIATTFFIRTAQSSKHWGWCAFAIIFFTLALSSRTNYLFLVPFVAVFLLRSKHRHAGLAQLTMVMACYLALTLPFYIYSPHEFPAGLQFRKLFQPGSALENAGLFILIFMCIMMPLLLFKKNMTRTIPFLLYCSLIQAIPLLALSGLQSIENGRLILWPAGYVLHFLFFLGTAAWLLIRPDIPRSFLTPAKDTVNIPGLTSGAFDV